MDFRLLLFRSKAPPAAAPGPKAVVARPLERLPRPTAVAFCPPAAALAPIATDAGDAIVSRPMAMLPSASAFALLPMAMADKPKALEALPKATAPSPIA